MMHGIILDLDEATMEKNQITSLVYTTLIVCGIVLIANGIVIEETWINSLSLVSGIVVLIALVFDRWLWKFRIFRDWLVKIPDISGTWQATLTTTWTRPNSNNPEPPLEGYFAIYQTHSTLHMKLMTKQSYSKVISAKIIPAPDESAMISVLYRNEPYIAYRESSPIHYGAMLLNVPSKKEASIKGSYWTDRATSGDIVLYNRSRLKLDDFDIAKKHFSS